MKFEKLYYDPKSPAGYAGGEQALYQLARKSSKKVKLDDVRNWLRKQQTYTLHKQIRRKIIASQNAGGWNRLSTASRFGRHVQNVKGECQVQILVVYYRYADVLPKLVDGYNHAYHRSIKRAPVSVTIQNEVEVSEILYGKNKSNSARSKLKAYQQNQAYI